MVTFRVSAHQLQIVAPIQRQFHNSFVVNHGPHCHVFGLQLNGTRVHHHGLRKLSDLQREIEPDRLLHLYLYSRALDGLESLMFSPNVVHPRSQRRKRVVSRAVAHRFSRTLVAAFVSETLPPAPPRRSNQ